MRPRGSIPSYFTISVSKEPPANLLAQIPDLFLSQIFTSSYVAIHIFMRKVSHHNRRKNANIEFLL